MQVSLVSEKKFVDAGRVHGGKSISANDHFQFQCASKADQIAFMKMCVDAHNLFVYCDIVDDRYLVTVPRAYGNGQTYGNLKARELTAEAAKMTPADIGADSTVKTARQIAAENALSQGVIVDETGRAVA